VQGHRARHREADNLATLMQSAWAARCASAPRWRSAGACWCRWCCATCSSIPKLQVDLSFEDRYVNLVEQGIDVALRMGRLADSTLGARYLGLNPWVMVGRTGLPEGARHAEAAADLAQHALLVYSTVQGDDRWTFTGPDGADAGGAGAGPAAQQQPVGRAGRRAQRHGPGDPALVRGATSRCERQRASRCWNAGRCRRRRSTPCSRRPSWCRELVHRAPARRP
jgi:hypothetical protein